MFAGLGASAAVLLLLFSSLAIGRKLLGNRTDAVFGPMLAALVQSALGLAVIAMVIYGLAFTQFNNPLVYLLVLLAPIVVGWRENLANASELLRHWGETDTGAQPHWISAAFFLIALAVAIRVLAALQPELGMDALSMHLVIADRLKATGTFHFDVTQSIWAVIPMAGDWVLAVAYMLSNEAGARLANLATDLMMVAMVYLGARQLRGRSAGVIAALIYSTLPLLFREVSTIYIENAWSLWLSAGLAVGLLSLREDSRRYVIVAAFLLGAAFSTKVITVFYLLAFFSAIAIVWISRNPRVGLRNVSIAVAVVALVGVVPYLNAWLRTGNPVFPFMNGMFGSPLFATAASFDNPLYGSGVSWRTLYDLTFLSGNYIEGRAGSIGIVIFLLGVVTPVAAIRENWLVRWGLIGSVVFVVGVFQFQSYLRYIMPMFPILAVCMGLCLARLVEESRALRAILLPILLLGSLANIYLTPAATWQYSELALPKFPGSTPWNEYRHRQVPETFAVDLLNVLGAKRVLWVGQPMISGAEADIFVNNWHGWNVARQISALRTLDAMNRWVAANKIDSIVVASAPGAEYSPSLREFVGASTRAAGSRGGVFVYQVTEDVLFSHELLVNPNFDSGSSGWSGDSPVDKSEGTVLVSASRPLQQMVSVKPTGRYLIEVEGHCSKDAVPFRVQVNWIGADGMLNADIDVQPCSADYQRHYKVVTAPAGAVFAQVYATGHDPDRPAELTRVSFRN